MKVVRAGVAIILLIGLVVCAWLFHRRDKPVVWALRDAGDPTGSSVFVWLNPFRDRTPERICESALKAFRDRNRQGIEVALRDVNGNEGLIDHELKNDVKKWSISEMRVEGGTAHFRYDAMRTNDKDSTPIYISLKRQGGTWQIVGWEAWY